MELVFWGIIALIVVGVIPGWIIKYQKQQFEAEYRMLEAEVLRKLGLSSWNVVSYCDGSVAVKSRQALEKYDDVKFFKDNPRRLASAEEIICRKKEVAKRLKDFLRCNKCVRDSLYTRLESQINEVIRCANAFRVEVVYVSSAGNCLGSKTLCVSQNRLKQFQNDPSLLMGKSEYNKYLKEQQKAALEQKRHEYYERVNAIIDVANSNRSTLVIKDGMDLLDKLIVQLFDRTVNSIKKIKSIDSEEWDIVARFIDHIDKQISVIISNNHKLLEYYDSPSFRRIKETCDILMSSQREFNEYISKKIQSISRLFGTRMVRNETVNEDEHNYIRPYKKTITPFTAEVSAAVFASAENNPLEYVVKLFYPDKTIYPKQIQQLRVLLEELETLKEAKQIIENYKAEYRQYLSDVPDFIMECDEAGFYSRLGFAIIDESVLTVEYKFSYTSGGGMAQRFFTVPMTEETIVELIGLLETKSSISGFVKEQRGLMTKKLREQIKVRDNYTCCTCGNSVQKEPNLLLEIDHIVPVSKGGHTVEENLQTLCWRCNRSKGAKYQYS